MLKFELIANVSRSEHVLSAQCCVFRLQTECSHYRMVSEEAYKQLMDIKEREILSKSQDIRLKDWLDLMEEVELTTFVSSKYLR